MEPILDRVAQSVTGAASLEGLTRPLLELLEALTGMESTYLTRIDLARGVQQILFARNVREMQIPEGLAVPWGDTLCKRALEEGRAYTADVGACWGDSDAARALGIRTYLSQPVNNLDGSVFGTLCAASASAVPVDEATIRVLGMFASLIAHQVERERVVDELRRHNEELSTHAMLDPLTGLANRRALLLELRRTLARAHRAQSTVGVAFIDLDGFKAINDRHGHEVGDQFLVHVARRLSAGLRSSDFIARYGGDEFVVISSPGAADELRPRLEELTAGHFALPGLDLDYGGASVGVTVAMPEETDPEPLLARADTQMYRIKQARRLQAPVAAIA